MKIVSRIKMLLMIAVLAFASAFTISGIQACESPPGTSLAKAEKVMAPALRSDFAYIASYAYLSTPDAITLRDPVVLEATNYRSTPPPRYIPPDSDILRAGVGSES